MIGNVQEFSQYHYRKNLCLQIRLNIVVPNNFYPVADPESGGGKVMSFANLQGYSVTFRLPFMMPLCRGQRGSNYPLGPSPGSELLTN